MTSVENGDRKEVDDPRLILRIAMKRARLSNPLLACSRPAEQSRWDPDRLGRNDPLDQFHNPDQRQPNSLPGLIERAAQSDDRLTFSSRTSSEGTMPII